MSLESRICREQTPRQGVKGNSLNSNSADFKGFWPGLLVNRVEDLVEIFEPLCQQEVCLGKKSSKKVNQNTILAMQYSRYDVLVYETYQKKQKLPQGQVLVDEMVAKLHHQIKASVYTKIR